MGGMCLLVNGVLAPSNPSQPKYQMELYGFYIWPRDNSVPISVELRGI
jgi:hypothetical protein